jgi:CHAD domain-containing protein
MAGAARIPNIKPKQSFRENGARVVEARLAEFLSWRSAIGDPSQVVDLHNMRIAAKRLRYALELFVLCFPDLKETLNVLTDIQESLGTIHDLDVLADMLRQRLQALDLRVHEDAVEVMAAADTRAERSNRLRAVLNASARDQQRLGLIGLLSEKVSERQTCYEEFRLRWEGPGLDLLAETIRSATSSTARDNDSQPAI